MVELGQLESRYAEFEKKNVRIVAVSLDNVEDTAATQKKFPHLTIISDAEANLSKAVEVFGPLRAQDGTETDSPTTILVDRNGQVRWVFRPDLVIERLSPDKLLETIDKNLRGG
jgi:peroxiredoxin